MIVRLLTLGLGYVLGTRAGRERYDQIKKVATATAQRLEDYGSDSGLATRERGTGEAT